MKGSNQPIRIKARWDHSEVPTGVSNQRGLLLEIDASKPVSTKKKKRRPSVNLAIVIDRSGSMHHGRLDAAKEAAIGIVNRLSWHDHLSVVVYDDDVRVLIDGERQAKESRPKTCELIQSIHTGGCTDLAGGWLRGARCVADVMDRQDKRTGHVILLSDGQANRGETEPEVLTRLAGNLAERGVTSSCVGIGHNYSPLQLNAIAEAGEGEMHHSNLVGGQQRRLAFLVELPEINDPRALTFECTANWLDVDTAMEELSLKKEFEIQVVPDSKFNKQEQNKTVARILADIWMARHGYDAMMLNEQGLYEEATGVFDYDKEHFAEFTANLEETRMLKEQREVIRDYSSKEWRGTSKLEALSMSKKAMRSKPDFRREHSKSRWTDFKPD